MIGRFAPRARAVWLCVLCSGALIAGCQEAVVTKTAAPASAPAAATASAATAAAGPVTFAGGDGGSVAEAILVEGAPSDPAGIAAEYQWLHDHVPGFRLERQALFHAGGRQYDQLDGAMPNGERRSVFFDITEFFGKL